MNYYKISWDNSGYAIVKPVVTSDQVKTITKKQFKDMYSEYSSDNGNLHEHLIQLDSLYDELENEENDISMYGKLIYGSRAKYSKSGKYYIFRNIKNMEELDIEQVQHDHFVGLL